MNNQKHTLLSFFSLLFFTFILVISVEGQTTIVANSTNTAAATSSTSNNTWTDVGSVDVTLSTGNSVLVLGTMESVVTSGNSNLTCKYRLFDGSTESPIISRYVAAKTYNDAGMSAIGYIYEYAGTSGSKTFKLQHAKDEPGASKKFTSKAVLVAMVIEDANISLPNDITTTGDVTTTSTSYVQVTGTKTDKITLTKPGGIYLTTSFSTKGSAALTASYVLRYSTDGTNFTEIPNATISRTNSTEFGAATISVLLEHQDADDYYFDVAHKTSTETLTTSNLSLCAVGLVDANGLVFPTFKLTGQSASTSSTSFVDAASTVNTSVNASNKLFMHTTFNMSSASIVANAAFQLAISGTGASFTAQTLERYIPASDIGSGGIIGLATGLSAYTDYTVKLQHKSSGTSLTTSNANIVGFQLTNIPTITWDAGSSTTDWNTANNWDPNQVPIEDVHVSIPNLVTDPEIGTAVDASCYNLTLSSGATLTIKSNGTSTGSLIVNGTATGDVTVERFLTHDRWHYISGQSNISGDFSALSMGLTGGVDSDQFYRWEENVNTWVDILNGNGSGSLMGAEGFTSSRGYGINYITTDKTLSLTGVPYTANQSIVLTKTASTINEGSNLVGNPFTSTIALNTAAATTDNFITQNAAALHDSYEAVYLWNEGNDWDGQRNSDYVTITNSTATATYAAPGQAFMVQAASNNATLNFNTTIRKHGSATFYKETNANPNQRFTLLVDNLDHLSNSTEVLFMSGMTKGLDPSYDAGKLKGNPNLALYTRLLEDNGVDFAIQALPAEGIEEFEISVGVDVAEAGEFTFSVTQEEMDNYNIVLEDREQETFTNLRWDTYTTAISESGTGRFYLQFKDATGVEENSKTNLQVWSSNSVIHIINADNQVGDIRVVNMFGQSVHTSALKRSENQQINLNVPTGYYVVSVVTQSGVVNKKVYL